MFGAEREQPQAQDLAATDAGTVVDARDAAAAITDTLRQLDVLKAAGIVDDAEYAEHRARILAAL